MIDVAVSFCMIAGGGSTRFWSRFTEALSAKAINGRFSQGGEIR